MGCAEATMRVTKPVGKNAVLGHPIQHSIRAHDGRVDCAGQHQRPDHHDERSERQPER